MQWNRCALPPFANHGGAENLYRSLLILTAVLVAVAMTLSLAHALEMPGKMRLDKDSYLAVQRIYYPGFTVGGGAEPLAIIFLLVLLVVTPYESARFWWLLSALAALVLAHAIYWFVTHPVNNVWTRDIQMTGLGATFFSLFAVEITGDWSRLRNMWEYSHVARSVFAMLSFVFVLMALTA